MRPGTRPDRRHVSRCAHDLAADRARDHRRHQGRLDDRADHDDEGSDRARDHAALPHRGRRGGGADDGAQLQDRGPRTASVSIEAAGLAPVGTHAATSGALASGAERRDDWRFAAKAPGSATVTATARTESDVDAVELPIPILPFGIRREVGKSGSVVGAGEADDDRRHARSVESGRAIDRRLACAVARRIAFSARSTS